MTASRFSVSHLQVGVGVLVLGLVACDNGRPPRFVLPTAPTVPPIAGAPPVPAPPPPHPAPTLPTRFGPLVYTPLEIGAVARGPLLDPPECVEFALWPCRYFQVTPPAGGTLVVVLTYSSSTQGGQGVDVSVEEADGRGEVWAQFGSPTETRVEAPVLAGRTYHIVMWYAFDRLEFELTTSLQPE